MSRPDPIQYAEHLYDAIAAASFSPIAFLAFGNAVKDGVPFRNMPRMAAEPFMRVVGEMLDLEEEADQKYDLVDAALVTESASVPAVDAPGAATPTPEPTPDVAESASAPAVTTALPSEAVTPASAPDRRRSRR